MKSFASPSISKFPSEIKKQKQNKKKNQANRKTDALIF